MVELGTRLAYRKSEGRKLSTYGCARRISTRRRRLPDGDALQRLLRSRLRARLTPSVGPLDSD